MFVAYITCIQIAPNVLALPAHVGAEFAAYGQGVRRSF